MMLPPGPLDRRRFLRTTAAGLGAAAALACDAPASAQAPPAATRPDESRLIWRSRAPEMEYRRLGRTNYMVSRIVAGRGGNPAMWRRMLERGMNYIDSARGYGDDEVQQKEFVGRNRDRLWITSKATGIAGYDRIDETVQRLYREAMKAFLGDDSGDLLELHKKAVARQKETGQKPDLRPVGKHMAAMYVRMLEESLGRLGLDCVDSYFMHGVEIPWMFDCLEVWEAYEKAHKAGKIRHFGFSCHRHHQEVLAAAAEADARGPWKIDLIMPGVNPETFDGLRETLSVLKKQDIGIIAMKTSGIRNRPLDGREKKFADLMGGREYNEWERAKLWMLHLSDGLIDACIAGMKSNEEMEKDLALPSVRLTAEARRELRAVVKLEMAGACHLCGDCDSACPEHIAVADMIRYHAYVHQYDEKQLARELYALAGYDPHKVCSHCGRCEEVCASKVPITELLGQLSRDMA